MVELGQDMSTMLVYGISDTAVPGHNALIETEDCFLVGVIRGVHYLLFHHDEAHAALGPPRIIAKVSLRWQITFSEIGLVSGQNRPVTHQRVA
jgi:hypothetical protein